MKTHSIESRCVIGTENILFEAGPYIFQPGNCAGWDIKGVNANSIPCVRARVLFPGGTVDLVTSLFARASRILLDQAVMVGHRLC